MRGHVTIALDNPKCKNNVGGVMRAVGNYKANMVVVAGVRPQRFMHNPTDTMRTWKHIPAVMVDSVFDAIPYGAVPIAIDLLQEAESLVNFTHPERAFYIFGAEDATLGKRITDRCARKVYVPTNRCMNLAATVNVVLYDRMAKRG